MKKWNHAEKKKCVLMAVCSLVSPGGHSLNEDFLGAMCSWEARVQAWKTGWAYSFIRQHVIWHLKNPFLFFLRMRWYWVCPFGRKPWFCTGHSCHFRAVRLLIPFSEDQTLELNARFDDKLVMVHACNPSAGKAEAGRLYEFTTAWGT